MREIEKVLGKRIERRQIPGFDPDRAPRQAPAPAARPAAMPRKPQPGRRPGTQVARA